MDSLFCRLHKKRITNLIDTNSFTKQLLIFTFLFIGLGELSAQNLNITSGTNASFDENGNGVVYTAEATSDQFSIFFSLGESKDEALFFIEEISGELTFLGAPDAESPQDGDGDNVYEVEIIAIDFFNSDESITLSVTVNDVNEFDPEIDGTNITANVAEGETAISLSTPAGDGLLSATDGDISASLNFSITGGTDADKFNIQTTPEEGFTTGTLSFKAAPDFESPTDADGNNVYEVTVTASDGMNTDTRTIMVTVTDVAEANPLSFTSGTTANFAENGNGTVYTAEATSDQFSIFFSLGNSKDEALFFIEEISGELTFNTPPDFENPQDGNTDNVYEVEIIASDFANANESITVSITVTDVAENVNDPIITSDGGGAMAAIHVAENTTAVTTVTATDADAGSSITYSKSGTDEAFFSLDANTGVLTFTSAPDFESPADDGGDNTYVVTVTASDGSRTDAQTITVTVTDVAENNNDPVITSDGGGATAAINVAENTTAVTTVMATDADAGSSITFSKSGTDEAFFSLDANTGVLTFTSAPDFETPADDGGDNTYVVTVTASDGSRTDAQTITVSVTDVAENNNDPVITSNGGGATAAIDVAENTTAVTTVTATDADAGSSLTFSKSGTDEAFFSLDANTGVLAFTSAPDFESPADDGGDNTYVVTVTASDGSRTDTQTITVTVTDVQEADVTAPVFTSGTGGEYLEGDMGTAYTATATDAGTVTFTLGTTKDEALFGISNGGITFNAIPDFENPLDADQNNTYLLDVIATDDANNSSTQAITITVENINDNDPVITSNGAGTTASVDVAENTTAVTTVTATDADNLAALTFTITGGADQGLFEINSGALAFKAAPDFENPGDNGADNDYEVVVTVSDTERTDTQTITVTVTDANDNAPVITSNEGGELAFLSISENSTAVTTVTATDVDGNTSLSFTKSGTDGALFTINANTGVLTFTSAPDFENPTDDGADNTYVVEVTVSDGTNSDTQTMGVTVTDVNDNDPVITSNGGGATSAISVAENTTAVTTVTATDADPTASLTYAKSGTDEALFSIDANTGELTFITAPDFENPTDVGANNTYLVTVTVSDGNNSDTQDITVTVTDANDNSPVISSNGGGESATISVAENSPAVTTVTATDVDTNTSLSFSKSGTDADLFTIDANTGVLTFTNAPDFEAPADNGTDNSYQVNVIASDGTNADLQAITITVTGLDDTRPVITSGAAATVAENTSGTAIYTITATDVDTDDSQLQFGILGADADKFEVFETNKVRLKNPLDFEKKESAAGSNTFSFFVAVEDGTNGVATQELSISLTDVNEAPVITHDGQVINVNSNAALNIPILATDPDAGDQIKYSYEGKPDWIQVLSRADTLLEPISLPDSAMIIDYNDQGEYIFIKRRELFSGSLFVSRTGLRDIEIVKVDASGEQTRILNNDNLDANGQDFFEALRTAQNLPQKDVDFDNVAWLNDAIFFSTTVETEPIDIVLTDSGEGYFIQKNSIRKIDFSNRKITLFAGNDDLTASKPATAGDAVGDRLSARFNDLAAIVDDNEGNLYVTDRGNDKIKKINIATGNVTTVASTGLNYPSRLAIDSQGNLYVSDITKIKKVTPNGQVSDFAGTDSFAYATIQNPNVESIGSIQDMVMDQNDQLIILEDEVQYSNRPEGSHRVIRSINSQGEIKFLFGSNEFVNENHLPDISDPDNIVLTRLKTLAFNPAKNELLVIQYQPSWNRINEAYLATQLILSRPESFVAQPALPISSAPFDIKVTATDRAGLFDQETYRINVLDKTPPVINPITRWAFRENISGVVYSLSSEKSNNPNETISYAFAGGPDDSKFSIDATTGSVSVLQAKDFENPDDSDNNGIYNLSFTASDNAGNKSEVFELELLLTNKNENPEFTSNPSPDFTSTTDNEEYNYPFTTRDIDGDAVTVVGDGLPDWLSILPPSTSSLKTIATLPTLSFFGISFSLPDVKADSRGNIWAINYRDVFRITSDGTVRPYNLATQQPNLVLKGKNIALTNILSLAIDTRDNVYLSVTGTDIDRTSDTYSLIVRLTDQGTLSYVGGGLKRAFNEDLKDSPSDIDGFNFRDAFSIAFDEQDRLIVAESKGILRLEADGKMHKLASLSSPRNLTTDNSGNIYFSGSSNISKLDTEGNVTVIPSDDFTIKGVTDLAWASDQLYVTTSPGINATGNASLLKIDLNDNSIETVLNKSVEPTSRDGNLDQARITRLSGIIVKNGTNFIVVDDGALRELKSEEGPIRLSGNPNGKAGLFPIKLVATDGKGGEAIQSYSLFVRDKTPPTVLTPARGRFFENVSNSLIVKLEGSDNFSAPENLNYFLIEGEDAADNAFFELSTGGELKILEAQDVENPKDSDADGVYELGIRVSDQFFNSTFFRLSLTLSNENEAPVFTTEPTAQQLNVPDNVEFEYEYLTKDPEDDLVNVTYQGPTWLEQNTGTNNGLSAIAPQGATVLGTDNDLNVYYVLDGQSMIKKRDAEANDTDLIDRTTLEAQIRNSGQGNALLTWIQGISGDGRIVVNNIYRLGSVFPIEVFAHDVATNQSTLVIQNLDENAEKYLDFSRFLERSSDAVIVQDNSQRVFRVPFNGSITSFNVVEPEGISLMNRTYVPDGTVYFTDVTVTAGLADNPFSGTKIYRSQNGQVEVFAGGESGWKDGPRAEAQFVFITDMVAADDGTLYVLETDRFRGYAWRGESDRARIRKIDTSGNVSTLFFWNLTNVRGKVSLGDLSTAFTRLPTTISLFNGGFLIDNSYTIGGASGDPVLKGATEDQVGTHEVTLTASDIPYGLSTEQKFTITVFDATAPVFTSANTTTVPENSTAPFFTLKAIDTNSKATLGYALPQGANADNEKFSVNTSTGEISAIDPLDFESPNDFDEDGKYILDVLVSDGLNVTLQKLTVTLINANDAPEITSDPVIEVNDNETYNYPFTTADEDGDNVSVNGTDLPDWLQLNNEGDATVSSIAGGSDTPGADGTGSDANIGPVRDLVTQDNSDFYFLELINNRSIRKFNLQGEVTTLAGDASQPAGDQDGTGKNARFTFLNSITFGPDGNLYVSDFNKIRKITLAGEVTTYAGAGSKLIDEAQNLTELKFSSLGALAFDSKGNLFAVEGGSLLVKIEPDGTVSKFAGDTEQGYQDGTGLNARFKSIWKLLVDNEDNIFLTDIEDYRVRKVASDGVASTVAGSGVQGFNDGNSTTAQFSFPSALALDSEGNLLVSEGGGLFGGSKAGIRKIDNNGNVTTTFLKDQAPGNVDLVDGNLSESTLSYFYDFALVGSDIIFGDADRIRRISGEAGSSGLTGDPTGKVGTYQIKLTPNDGTVKGEVQEFTLTVKDATAPTIADIDALSYAENSTSTVVDVNATDTNPNAQITYSLGTSKDEAAFNVNATTGVISFATAPDFEAPADANGDNTYLLDVKASDGINESTVPIQVTVTNVNESPTDLAIATNFDEDVASGQGLSAMLSTDVDAGETFTYSLIAGSGDTDNTSFEVNGTTLSTKVDFDFETQASYNIRLRTTDAGGLTFDKAFILTINDLNEAPTDITQDNTAIDENNSVDDAIGNLSTTDEDGSETHSYTLVSGEGDTDNASFDIVDGGLVAKAIFDFETKASHSVRVRTTDKGGLTFDKVFTISINDINEAPTDITLGRSAIDENNAIDDPVTLFVTTDEDPSDTHTYSLVTGEGDTDNASFEAVNGGLLAKEVFDFEDKSSYSIRIMTTDQDGLSFEKSFTISINDVEEAPTDITLDNASIAENNDANAAIGSFTTTDDDNSETFTYSLVAGDGGDDNAAFTITGAQLTVNNALDFEAQSSYSIRVESADGAGLTFEKSFTISVTDAPEPIIRLEHTDPVDPAPLGLSLNINVEVFNDGDGPLQVSEITYPEGFSGPASLSDIAAGASNTLTVVFTPLEARAYTGDLLLTYNGGVESLTLSASGALITSADLGRLNPEEVKLYPNPAQDVFNLDLSAYQGAPVTVGLFTAAGTTVQQEADVRTDLYQVDISRYKQGVYLVVIRSARQTIMKKLMIRR